MIAPVQRRTRVGCVLVMAGLGIQLAASLAWGPGMFIVSAALGLPLVLVGAVLVLVDARRPAADKGPEGPHAPA